MMQNISQFGRILGSLFYYSPKTEQNQPLVALLQNGEWQRECDFIAPEVRNAIQTKLAQTADLDVLENEYQRLFIGPDALPAPPWGSVYLDKEKVIFGDSLVALREFMTANGLEITLSQNEPEDHFGLMLLLSAYLAEQQAVTFAEFFANHLLPWSYRFLTLLQAEPDSFYTGLAQLAELLLKAWQMELSITPKQLEIYR